MNFTVPVELQPYIANEFAHQNVCQLAFDQFSIMTGGLAFIEKSVLIALAGMGVLYLITMWRLKRAETLLERIAQSLKETPSTNEPATLPKPPSVEEGLPPRNP